MSEPDAKARLRALLGNMGTQKRIAMELVSTEAAAAINALPALLDYAEALERTLGDTRAALELESVEVVAECDNLLAKRRALEEMVPK